MNSQDWYNFVLTDLDRRLWAQWKEYRARRREETRRAGRFEPAWLRWVVTAFSVAMLANCFQRRPDVAFAGAVACMGFGFVLCLYFAWILFRRMQCSLLQWCVLTAALGLVEGLVISSPNFTALGMLLWSLVPMLGGWILYGAVRALVQGRLLGIQGSLPGTLLMGANWWILAAPALFLGGLFLALGHAIPKLDNLVGSNLAQWGWPLLGMGIPGLGLRYWLERRIRRKFDSPRALHVGLAKITVFR